MLNYDFSPFYRSTIGFDRLLGLLDKTAGLEASAPSAAAARNIVAFMESDPRSAVPGVEFAGRV